METKDIQSPEALADYLREKAQDLRNTAIACLKDEDGNDYAADMLPQAKYLNLLATRIKGDDEGSFGFDDAGNIDIFELIDFLSRDSKETKYGDNDKNINVIAKELLEEIKQYINSIMPTNKKTPA